jgi:hypothetical protein
MRPLDWLTACLAVVAIAGWLTEQVTGAWRDRRTETSGGTAPDSTHAAKDHPVVPSRPLAWSRRPVIGRRIAAGGQQLNSPRFSCSPAGGISRTEWDGAIGLQAGPPQPGESWPQPSLN